MKEFLKIFLIVLVLDSILTGLFLKNTSFWKNEKWEDRSHRIISKVYHHDYISSLLYLSIFGSIFAFVSYLKLLEKVGSRRVGYVGVVMPVLALIISTIFENLEWQYDLIIGLPILIIGAVLVINQEIKTI